MFKVILVLSIIVAGFSNPGSSISSLSIPNSGFESGLWQFYSQNQGCTHNTVQLAGFGYVGNSTKIEFTAACPGEEVSNGGGISQSFNLPAGNYSISAMVYGNMLPPLQLRMGIEGYSSVGMDYEESHIVTDGVNVNSWRSVNVIVNIPQSQFVKIKFWTVNASESTGTIYLDNFKLTNLQPTN